MLRIELLGTPTITRGAGEQTSPRGAKAWALLAYLLLADRPPPRSRLAALLFPDAADPGATLRWNLAELRRTLGEGVELTGDPVRLTLAPDATVDVLELRRGGWATAAGLANLGSELLEGLDLPDAAGFTLWLDTERRQSQQLTAGLLTDGARALAARGDGVRALELARRLVDLEPYDASAHALLVRMTADVDGRAAGEAALRDARSFLEREVGTSAADDLGTVLDRSLGSPRSAAGPSAVMAQLEAGRAAVAAGAGEAGVEALSRAVVGARATGQRGLLAVALLEVGSAMVHAARGTDDAGASALHEAAAIAIETGDERVAAKAHRELGYIELLLAHYDRAAWWLDRAEEHADGDAGELSWIDAVRSFALLDTGRHAEARTAAESSLARAETAGDEHAAAFALSGLGRGALLRGELPAARSALDASMERARAAGWQSFVPWPEAFRAEAELIDGDLDRAEELFAHAFALSCQLGDPCWESMAVRGLGLTSAARGDAEAAIDMLESAPRVCRRLPDSYQWIEAYALDALAEVSAASSHPEAAALAASSVRFAGDRSLSDLQLRGLRRQATLGVPGAEELADAMVTTEVVDLTAVEPATALAVGSKATDRVAGTRG